MRRSFWERATLRRSGLALAFAVLLASQAFALPAGATSGSLSPPHRDSGLDTNSDGLFNYLRIEVHVQVTEAGKFTVDIGLNDSLDLAELTHASTAAILEPGLRTVDVLLSGPDIYNGYVDGPYYAHLTLKSEYGTVLAAGTHVTAAYAYKDFQPFAARYVPPTSDRGLDNDTDGLYDWISLTLTVDVATAGTYAVESLLVDSTYAIGETWKTTVRLAPGRSSVTQLFLGYPLRLAGTPGPYLVTNSLYDETGSMIDFLFYTTADYPASSFEGPPVVLNPPHSDRGIDSNGDGLYSALAVTVGLAVERSQTVYLSGELRSAEGVLIQRTEMTVTLGPGAATVDLYFAGTAISGSGSDGPYPVYLRVRDLAGRVLSEGTHTTTGYTSTQFESLLLQLNPPHADAGVDANENARFESLRLFVNVSVATPGAYEFRAQLWDPLTMQFITTADRQVNLGEGIQDVALDFPGPAILSSGVDGPYRASIEVREVQTGSLLQDGGHRTKGYLASDFEAGASAFVTAIAGEEVLDTEGSPDGFLNVLRLTFRVTADVAGTYKAEGTLLKDGLSIASSATSAALPAGPSELALSFSGWDLRLAGRDGPYAASVTLRNLGNASAAPSTAAFTTALYQASAFQPAEPALLSGLVVAYTTNRPLAGAEIWAVNYSNAFARRGLSDSEGRFDLSLVKGRYRLVVDHEDAQARTVWSEVSGSTSANFTLFPPRQNLLHTKLIWQGWRDLVVAVQYSLVRDGAPLRLRLDWEWGDRDGTVEAFEEALLPAFPPSRGRDAIDRGSASDLVLVNWDSYQAQGESVSIDGILGSSVDESTPFVEFRRSFRWGSSTLYPPRVALSLQGIEDTLDWNRREYLFVPSTYRYIMHEGPETVYVYARWIPYTVDPQVNDTSPQTGADYGVSFLLYYNSLAPVATPAAPSALVARPEEATAVLGWSAPTKNTDGSRLANLAGYRVYRSTTRGSGYVRVDPVLITSRSFSDPSLAPGTYYYVVTAVNTDGRESAYSNEANVTVASATVVATAFGGLFLNEGAAVFGMVLLIAFPVVFLAGSRWRRRRSEHGGRIDL